MKKILFLSVFCLTYLAFGQAIRYVDTSVILEKMPQYKQAQQRLDVQVKAWQTDIERMQKEVDELKRKFQNEKVLLTEDQAKEKQNEIEEKDSLLKVEIEKRFGAEGDMFRLRESIVKPIQDQIWNAISAVAQKNKIDMIFDKNSDFALIYSNPKFDYTKEILKELKLSVDDKDKPSKPNTSSPKSTNNKAGKAELQEESLDINNRKTK